MFKTFAKQARQLDGQTFKYLITTRKIETNAKQSINKEFETVQIQVPWGKIEGKLWGSKDKQPVLSIHGWQENAGSFDIIAPLLEHSSILAIDLPGHGISSWLPKGIPYNENTYLQTIRIIVKKFGWEKVKLLGHSMGGIACYNYARTFPDEIQFVVSIDSLTFVSNNITRHSKKQAQAIDKFITFEENSLDNPPSYPEEEAIKRMIRGVESFSTLDVPTVKTLMIRGSKRKDDGTYYYTRDYRIGIDGLGSCYTSEDIKEMSELITCPYMVIKSSETPFRKTHSWKNSLEILKAKSSDFRFVEMIGTHHLHMMAAEEVANAINPFLKKYDV